MLRKILFLTVMASFILIGCTSQVVKFDVNSNNQSNALGVKLANPASVYCTNQGGKLEIKTDPTGQYGMCKFKDGSECEEWAYFNKKCKPGDSL